ncbi:MAG: DUF2391 family protein [Nitrospiraceae bacterium]|nr:DUF2391 family protein [Nitrospiraceae bacterium]
MGFGSGWRAFDQTVRAMLVLGFPAAVGAAASRMIL